MEQEFEPYWHAHQTDCKRILCILPCSSAYSTGNTFFLAVGSQPACLVHLYRSRRKHRMQGLPAYCNQMCQNIGLLQRGLNILVRHQRCASSCDHCPQICTGPQGSLAAGWPCIGWPRRPQSTCSIMLRVCRRPGVPRTGRLLPSCLPKNAVHWQAKSAHCGARGCKSETLAPEEPARNDAHCWVAGTRGQALSAARRLKGSDQAPLGIKGVWAQLVHIMAQLVGAVACTGTQAVLPQPVRVHQQCTANLHTCPHITPGLKMGRHICKATIRHADQAACIFRS